MHAAPAQAFSPLRMRRAQVCSAFIALAMLASTGLSAAAILRSKDDFWVLYDSKGATPAYRVQCACLRILCMGHA